jgi:hypothetical protein
VPLLTAGSDLGDLVGADLFDTSGHVWVAARVAVVALALAHELREAKADRSAAAAL